MILSRRFRSIDRLTGGSYAREINPTFHRIPADVIACPDPACGAPARIVDRWSFESTGGPVEHIKTGCERGHWFTPKVDSLDLEPVPARASPLLASAF
jgi:hypothetical protein